MTTPVLVIVGLLVIAGSSWITRRSAARDDAAPLASLMLPLALLFVVVPIPLASLQIIRSFQAYAETSENAGRAFAETAAFALTLPFWYGALACLFALLLATTVDLLRLRSRADSSTAADLATTTTSAGWLAAGSALLIVPVGLVVTYVGQLAPLLTSASRRLILEPGQPPSADAASMADWSAAIANRLITGVVAGGLLVAIVVAVAAVLMLTIQRSAMTRRHARVARAGAALATVALAAHAARLGLQLYR
jgi:hypothetical protein